MVQFKWYVLNETNFPEEQFNQYPYQQKNKVKPWNIFNNWVLNEEINKLCEEFDVAYDGDKQMTFDEFKERLRHELQYYLWSKVEYEICIGELHENDINKYAKIDCYSQVLPNLDILAREILAQYSIGHWNDLLKEHNRK